MCAFASTFDNLNKLQAKLFPNILKPNVMKVNTYFQLNNLLLMYMS